MKVSVVVTVFNEEHSIAHLLDSLLKQTRIPDEIVIVDGKSTDRTAEIIKDFQESYKLIKLYVQRGNISRGRNAAISKAKYPVIAQIDAGCSADKHWLERIIKPFEVKDTGLSAGFYEMTGKTVVQQAVAPFMGITPQNFDPRSFLPSGRSVAFRKNIWKEVGGYSENLQWAGEDTLFNYNILKRGIKIARVPEAFVYWEVPKNWIEIFIKFYKYAQGDAESKIWWHPGKNLATHNIKIALIFIRYLVGIMFFLLGLYEPFFWYLLIFGFAFYTSRSVWKMRNEVNNSTALILVPVVQITSDLAVMAGFITGLV